MPGYGQKDKTYSKGPSMYKGSGKKVYKAPQNKAPMGGTSGGHKGDGSYGNGASTLKEIKNTLKENKKVIGSKKTKSRSGLRESFSKSTHHVKGEHGNPGY